MLDKNGFREESVHLKNGGKGEYKEKLQRSFQSRGLAAVPEPQEKPEGIGARIPTSSQPDQKLEIPSAEAGRVDPGR